MFGLRKRAKRPPLDFAMIRGGSTEGGRKLGINWDAAYVSNGADAQAQELARFYLDWNARLIERQGMRGFIEPDATDANVLALEIARNVTQRSKVLCTNLSHSSIRGACDRLGLQTIVVDADPQQDYRVDDALVRDAVGANGADVAAVVSTYGTTQLGHIENLSEVEIVRELRANGSWLHVDAAYGGYVGMLSRHVKKPIPDADTVTLDPYKFIGRQGCSILFVDEGRAPVPNTKYYNQSPFTLRTSLSAGPIATWYGTMKGCDDVPGLRWTADECIELAHKVAHTVVRNGGSLIRRPELSIVPIALESPEAVQRVYETLLGEDYSVGLVDIEGRNYRVHGVRIVITPKVNLEHQVYFAEHLAERIAKLGAE